MTCTWTGHGHLDERSPMRTDEGDARLTIRKDGDRYTGTGHVVARRRRGGRNALRWNYVLDASARTAVPSLDMDD